MSTYLPPEVQAGLDAARVDAMRKSSRLRIEAGQDSYAVLRAWDGGFALRSAGAPNLRGLVDLYDGARHLSRCLIIASEDDGGEMRFDIKRVTEAGGEQPVDFARAPDAPVALLTKS